MKVSVNLLPFEWQHRIMHSPQVRYLKYWKYCLYFWWGGFVHRPSFPLQHYNLNLTYLIHPHPNFVDFLLILKSESLFI